MLLRLALVGAPAPLILIAGGSYSFDYGTLNPFEAPPLVKYQGCSFHPTQTVESLESATNFEHNALAYASMPVRRVGTLNVNLKPSAGVLLVGFRGEVIRCGSDWLPASAVESYYHMVPVESLVLPGSPVGAWD